MTISVHTIHASSVKHFRVAVLAAAFLAAAAPAAHATWSIILIDSKTNEIAIGSSTCLTQFDLEAGLPMVLVGVGAGAAQSAIDSIALNRALMRELMLAGKTPEEILAALAAFDASHQSRQYGIADVHGRTVTFSGFQNGAFANGLTGQLGSLVYSIQGNVLTGMPVLTMAEQAVLNTAGGLPEKLMAGMQAARAMGGDGRCSCDDLNPTGCGSPPAEFTKSAHIGFMIDMRIGDTDGSCNATTGCASGDYYMNFNIAFQNANDPDPVVQLQNAFNSWRAGLIGVADAIESNATLNTPTIPADGSGVATLTITVRDFEGTGVPSAGLAVSVEHAEDSEQTTSIGAVGDMGGGVFEVTLTGSTSTGLNRYVVTVDDGVRPVILMPNPTLRSLAVGASVRYVDPDASGILSPSGNGPAPPNDGTSWCNAFLTIDDALAVATAGDVILVADGTYTPDTTGLGDPREATFTLVAGTTLQGGFQGCGAADPDDLDVVNNQTILTGDLNGDDDSGGDNSENAYHVVIAEAGLTTSTVLSGVTLTAGNSNGGAAPNVSGGGMLVGDALTAAGSSPTLRNVALSNNTASSFGGGVFVINGSPVIEGCVFDNNNGSSGGGGLFLGGNGNSVLRGCVFTNNTSNTGGGAYLFPVSSGTVTVLQSRFEANSATDGGGFAIFGSVTAMNTEILNNTATTSGGGIFSSTFSAPTLVNCLLDSNESDLDGGGLTTDSSDLELINCTLHGNRAARNGGGMLQMSSNPVISNTILFGNEDDSDGSAGGPFIDESAQIHTIAGTPAVDHSLIQGLTGGLGGIGNIGDDPQFVDAPGGNLRLRPGSPAIEAGDNAAVPADQADLDADGDVAEQVPFDLDGNARFFDGDFDDAMTIVDMGAFESQVTCRILEAPLPEPYALVSPGVSAPKNRYLTIIPPPLPSNSSGIALRVTFSKMPGPDDCPLMDDFSDRQGDVMWIGQEVVPVGVGPTGLYRLQNEPLFRDWNSELSEVCVGAVGTQVVESVLQCNSEASRTKCEDNGGSCEPVLIVSDCNIIPCAEYTVHAVLDTCSLADEAKFSPGTSIDTTDIAAACPSPDGRWADVVGAFDPALNRYNPPDGCVDFNDIAALVERFKNLSKAPPRTWCDLVGGGSDAISDETLWQGALFNIDFVDIQTIVGAFKGTAFPLGGPTGSAQPCP